MLFQSLKSADRVIVFVEVLSEEVMEQSILSALKFGQMSTAKKMLSMCNSDHNKVALCNAVVTAYEGDFAQAFAQLEELREKEPQLHEAWILSVFILSELGFYTDSKKLFGEFQKKFVPRNAFATASSAKGSLRISFPKTNILEAGIWESSIRNLSEMLPSSSSVELSHQGGGPLKVKQGLQHHINEAKEFISKNQPKKALTCLDRARESFPKASYLFVLSALCCTLLERYELARGLLKHAKALGDNSDLLFVLDRRVSEKALESARKNFFDEGEQDAATEPTP